MDKVLMGFFWAHKVTVIKMWVFAEIKYLSCIASIPTWQVYVFLWKKEREKNRSIQSMIVLSNNVYIIDLSNAI